jgi:uncharacterized protein (DUF305 family)
MRAISALLLAVAVAGCRTAADPAPAIIQPGAPGEESRVVTAREAADLSRVQHTPADVAFMQGMIHHHAQALEMVALLQTRTQSDEMRSMGQRIELSQRDEIGFMREWLLARGEDAPDEHAHHMGPVPTMPGMATPEDMEALAAAMGASFDRLFLNLMITHHLGAVTMVDELLATPGAAEQTDVFAFTADVVADQQAEMDRMSAMLAALSK